ncbi:PAN domain-containing protein [Cyclospora cayetanensis]|uniref:PAN domain-containing protein n=1 Tax=Cyclospora cayetanensis TaxID=88456 RepID=A0A1D3CZB5_9EIME|nr:PAN domain-containing protein [Cyclospora cayetanensis]
MSLLKAAVAVSLVGLYSGPASVIRQARETRLKFLETPDRSRTSVMRHLMCALLVPSLDPLCVVREYRCVWFVCAFSSQETTCFEQGVDYHGYDILTLSGVGSPSLCMESCGLSGDCRYWSWNSETNTCYLKSAGAFVNRTNAEKVISGPRSCHDEDGCFSEGVDYLGYDLTRIEGQEVASAAACQALCVAEPKCAFFSYKISSKDCYLKTAAAPMGRAVDANVISGPRDCSQVSTADEAPGDAYDLPSGNCAEGSTEYRGRDIDVRKNVRSAAFCQQLCAANTACFHWTWDRNRHICYQKDEFATEFRSTGRHTLGKVSGAKDCIPLNPGMEGGLASSRRVFFWKRQAYARFA